MKVKTFQGRTMAEALGKVKRHFGRDAVILTTRTFTKGGFLGLGGTACVEITATRQAADVPSVLRRGRAEERCASPERTEGAPGRSQPARRPEAVVSSQSLLAELGALKALVSDLVRETQRSKSAHVPEALFDTYLNLVQSEVAEVIAERLIEQVRSALPAHLLQDERAVSARLAESLEAMLPTAGPIRLESRAGPTVIALVGPTGVGKTTTVAKLAANFCLRDRKRVGLITIDTYRIAAVEQLKTYAQIIDVPLEIVSSPEEMRLAVRGMADRDVVLVDTAGRSQRDAIKIKELKRFFDAAPPDEVHLVLSSTASEAVLTEAIERFSEIGVGRVIFTKIDEAIGFGVILTCLQKANASLSYITTGQDVPDDIEVGEGRLIADLILRENTEGGEHRRTVSLSGRLGRSGRETPPYRRCAGREVDGRRTASFRQRE
jgi:flagellar biosynthesis protein FlhF